MLKLLVCSAVLAAIGVIAEKT